MRASISKVLWHIVVFRNSVHCDILKCAYYSGGRKGTNSSAGQEAGEAAWLPHVDLIICGIKLPP